MSNPILEFHEMIPHESWYFINISWDHPMKILSATALVDDWSRHWSLRSDCRATLGAVCEASGLTKWTQRCGISLGKMVV
jgi:hypothetical protein